jgi:biofilm PGA synthesis N-glycosyltransferase PgaC
MLLLLGISWVIILLFWISFFWAYLRLAPIKQQSVGPYLPVSVIISCKNGSSTILKSVEAVLAQDYQNFELIVIDDFSKDNTYALLSDIKNPLFNLLTAAQDVAGKKAALTQAIHASKNDILLFTDADCIPTSKQWIKSMVHSLRENESIEVVLGYGPMFKKPTYLNVFARFETWLTAVQYFSYALLGIPYMGVGRNLLYKKSVFFKANGFENHIHIASGDDDLLISAMANQSNIAINIDPNAFVYSEAKENVVAYLSQKTRHISTSVRYKKIHQFLLAIFAVSQVSFYGIIIIALVLGQLTFKTALMIIILKWILQFALHFGWMHRLKSKDLAFYFPVLDLIIPIYYIFLTMSSVFRKKNDW